MSIPIIDGDEETVVVGDTFNYARISANLYVAAIGSAAPRNNGILPV
jgi:hypothetical protein